MGNEERNKSRAMDLIIIKNAVEIGLLTASCLDAELSPGLRGFVQAEIYKQIDMIATVIG